MNTYFKIKHRIVKRPVSEWMFLGAGRANRGDKGDWKWAVCLMYLYGIDNETCCKCFKQGGRERW
jgi:hypothetical protein